jgi:hypothetical protein
VRFFVYYKKFCLKLIYKIDNNNNSLADGEISMGGERSGEENDWWISK